MNSPRDKNSALWLCSPRQPRYILTRIRANITNLGFWVKLSLENMRDAYVLRARARTHSLRCLCLLRDDSQKLSIDCSGARAHNWCPIVYWLRPGPTHTLTLWMCLYLPFTPYVFLINNIFVSAQTITETIAKRKTSLIFGIGKIGDEPVINNSFKYLLVYWSHCA